jgi:hypothetical protein
MTQNTSSAVMQQRKEARDALDDFPTPPWATRALCEWLRKRHDLKKLSVREPCANRGYMVAPLAEYFGKIEASDVHDYGAGFPVDDYLFGPAPDQVGFTAMNPPFRLAQQFIERALGTSTVGVAEIVRSAFLEGQARYTNLFSETPPSAILQFTERVVMHKGRVVADGSSATAYSWLIWDGGAILPFVQPLPPEFHWIAPCRKELERPGDYEPRGNYVD